ncbi:hypothetical protein B0T20DRAFT_347708 [Sordaria brevicollis]|uniref:Uncharacterized protein n=1 Tax=Sordaria brevicollis TaxID=83679 RepID=A0AAE0UES1_SORBR|nr:hypothetical protein B0T20DRAFT_347708 [Sordaria brevicollis]
MNSSIDSPYPQAPRRTYLRRSSSTIGSFATALSSLTPPTEDDIPLRELSRQNVPKVTTPHPSPTPQPSPLPFEIHNDAQDPVLHTFIMRASGLNADDIEYGPKTLDDYLRGDNAVQRTINLCRYVQMEKLPLTLSLFKNIAVMALYSYALIWFLDLRDTWRKLKLEDYESRNHWFMFLTLYDASLLIITVYKAIRNVSRLQGASYEKHTFLDFTYVTAPVGTRHPLAIPVRLLAGMKVTATLCPCMNSMDMATVQLAMQTTTDIILMTITALASALPAKYHTLINIATLTFGKAFPAAGRGRTRCRRNPHLLAHR